KSRRRPPRQGRTEGADRGKMELLERRCSPSYHPRLKRLVTLPVQTKLHGAELSLAVDAREESAEWPVYLVPYAPRRRPGRKATASLPARDRGNDRPLTVTPEVMM